MGEIIAFPPTEDQKLADEMVNACEREALAQIADTAAYLECKAWSPDWALGGERELSEALFKYRFRERPLSQLTLFVDIEDSPPAVSRYRRRLQRVAAAAFELGRRRAGKRPIMPVPRSLGAAAVSPVHLDRADRAEIAALARRVERLTISRIDPEFFHVEKSEIAAQLKRIARRA
jgi:hypothetical protein